jgi:RimJ/RimL family protein N-acetyltransferase
MTAALDVVPVLSTARLTLRGPRAADFEPYAGIMTSPRAVHMDGPFSRRDAWSAFAAAAGQWLIFGHGTWSIESRATGDWLGEVGVTRPDHFPETELGWMLTEAAEGRGYAREAASAVLGWVWSALGLATLVSYIGPANRSSIRLAERLGARLDPSALRPENDACLVYRHQRREVRQ